MSKIHKFYFNIDVEELPKKFTYPFSYIPHYLCIEAYKMVREELNNGIYPKEEIDKGKMFGVLVVQNNKDIGFLAAFSGNLGEENKFDYFVPPIFDLLNKDGFFKQREIDITLINKELKELQEDKYYCQLKTDLVNLNNAKTNDLLSYKAYMKDRKLFRDAQRQVGVEGVVVQNFIKESQFLKAEYKRKEKEWNNKIALIQDRIHNYEVAINNKKQQRANLSLNLQNDIFKHYLVKNALNHTKNIIQIFEDYSHRHPPAGTGECAAPKLLQYAYINGYKPIVMAEFWVGASQEMRQEGNFYPSCHSKCEPLLTFMLEGIEVDIPSKNIQIDINPVYEDNYYLVVKKPFNLLTVPGKKDEISLYQIIKNKYPHFTGPIITHRLDMATSGIVILAKNIDAYIKMQGLFANRRVNKIYIAILDGKVENNPNSGTINLPLCANIYDRPRQQVDYLNGKEAITNYKIIEYKDGGTKIEFYPKTGRTHQLRVHAAHINGLNCPIKGDNLYGKMADRLYLQAIGISFKHPYNGKQISISISPEF